MTKEQELQKALQAAQDALIAYQSKPKPAVWVPQEGELYHFTAGNGRGENSRNDHLGDRYCIARGNSYQTSALERKAAEYSRVQGLINQACLNVESDYVPDWFDNTTKWIPLYDALTANWIPLTAYSNAGSEISQSTEAKCLQVCDILNNINLKPVGVK